MTFFSISILLVLTIGIFGQSILTENSLTTGHPIQIVRPLNHSFTLELYDLKAILNADEVKDRYVVVVSISGAFRKGKSFLLNFFLRYLYAQYENHDVSDWLGESEKNSELRGFEWKGGRNRTTTGIWMYSKIFTHDTDDGQKLAIILLDTQGIFDSTSSFYQSTTVFALTTMLLSVQCYNLMHNIQEDDLANLHLFAEYGKLALEQSKEKPFQNLLFIVRDWPYADETNYGWDGKRVLDQLFAENDDQTNEMRELRIQIKSSFEEMNAFFMPHPGFIVAQSKNFTGDLKDISSDFKIYLKELVQGLLAPKNLVIKKINGEKVRASDFPKYFEAYVNVFKSGELPETTSILKATQQTHNIVVHNDLLHLYYDTMETSVNEEATYLDDTELLILHTKTKNEVLEKFRRKPKFGGDEMSLEFQQKLSSDIESKLTDFQQQNYWKRRENAANHNKRISQEIESKFKEIALNGVQRTDSYLEQHDLNDLLRRTIESALMEYDSSKIGDGEASDNIRNDLWYKLHQYESKLKEINDSKWYDYYGKNTVKTGGFAVAGAAFGAAVAGPPGAIFGALFGALFSKASY